MKDVVVVVVVNFTGLLTGTNLHAFNQGIRHKDIVMQIIFEKYLNLYERSQGD